MTTNIIKVNVHIVDAQGIIQKIPLTNAEFDPITNTITLSSLDVVLALDKALNRWKRMSKEV